jgi:hypothetical protein
MGMQYGRMHNFKLAEQVTLTCSCLLLLIILLGTSI